MNLLELPEVTEQRALALSACDADRVAQMVAAGDRLAAQWVMLLLRTIGRTTEPTNGAVAGFRIARGFANGSLTSEMLRWRDWVLRKLSTLHARMHRATSESSDPWKRKAATWAMSIKLRAADAAARTVRGGPRRFAAATWSQAAERMLQAANNHISRGKLNPWKKWAMNVSKNLNRRIEGRYACRQAGDDQSKRPDGDAGTTGSPLCVLGPTVDAGDGDR